MAPRPETTERSDMSGTNGSCPKKSPSLSEMPSENHDFSETVLKVPPKDRRTPTTIVPPDGGWGWMVLLGTMTINIVVIGHGKSFGVYFKNLMDEFDASPSRVAWLQSLQIFMFSFLSPLASVLSQLVGPRKVALVGGLMAFVGLTISALTPSLEFLYIFFGVVQGVALTFTFTPGITMIAKYFNRRRGLANGLTMAGNALGGIIMPLVAHKLISEYALRGCFLIMGSLLLNSCVGAMLWQPVEWHQKKTPIENVPILEETLQEDLLPSTESPGADTLCIQEDSVEASGDEEGTAINKENFLQPHHYESGLDLSLDSTITVKVSAPEMCVDRKHVNMYASGPNLYSNRNFIKVPNMKIPRGGSSPHLADTSRLNERTYGSSVSTESLPGMFKLVSKKKHGSRASSFMYLSSYSFGPTAGAVLTKEHFTGLESNCSKVTSDDSEAPKKLNKWRISPCIRKLAIDQSIFEKSRFYFMTCSLFFHVLGYQGTQIFLPYRATTLGLSQAHAASFLSVLSFTDLVGRITCAWISDFHLCPRKYWFIGGMFMSGVFAYSLPFYKSYATLLIGTAGFGFCCGSYIGLVVVLFADAYSSEQVALAYSVSTVSGGFMALGGAPLMGYVLESTGSYMICQAILGSAQFAGAAVWLAEPWAMRLEKRRQEEKNKMKSPEEEQLV